MIAYITSTSKLCLLTTHISCTYTCAPINSNHKITRTNNYTTKLIRTDTCIVRQAALKTCYGTQQQLGFYLIYNASKQQPKTYTQHTHTWSRRLRLFLPWLTCWEIRIKLGVGVKSCGDTQANSCESYDSTHWTYKHSDTQLWSAQHTLPPHYSTTITK